LGDLAVCGGEHELARSRFCVIDRVDVSADPDGELVVKACFTALRAPTRQQDPLVARDHAVGDELLPGGSPLGASALDEEAVLAPPLEQLAGFSWPREGVEALRIAGREEPFPWGDEDELH